MSKSTASAVVAASRESKAKLTKQFPKGAPAQYVGETARSKSWLTARTALVVKGVVACHSHLYIKLSAKKNGDEVTIHLAPGNLKPLSKKVK